jgi:ribosome maturation factor RimP
VGERMVRSTWRIIPRAHFFLVRIAVSTQNPVSQTVERAVLPVLSHQGYELVLCEYVPMQKILRLFIDREGGVSVDDCTKVSRLVSDLLDAEGISDTLPAHYNLEVSSPGLDRPLVKPKDFQRFLGRAAKVETREPIDGRRRFAGELTAADDRGISMTIDGKPYAIAYGSIERARLVPDL